MEVNSDLILIAFVFFFFGFWIRDIFEAVFNFIKRFFDNKINKEKQKRDELRKEVEQYQWTAKFVFGHKEPKQDEILFYEVKMLLRTVEDKAEFLKFFTQQASYLQDLTISGDLENDKWLRNVYYKLNNINFN